MLKPQPSDLPEIAAAIDRADATIQRMRAKAFAGSRLPYPREENMTVETFPQTDLGSAAATVVANLDSRRSIKWPPKALVAGAPTPKITKPGIYDMPIELYHTPDLCDGPSVSSSGALKVEQKSLLHFWDEYVNPEREPFEKSESMITGSAVHHLVLGESGFAQKFAERPKQFDSWRTDAAKKWRADQWAAGREVLIGEQIKTIRGIARNLERHQQVRDGLLSGAIEQSMIVKDRETGLYLKARPDVMALSETVICDLKTVAEASDDGCNRMMSDREYQFQLAFAGIVYEQLFGRAPGNEDYVLVLCESKRPYAVTVRPIDINAVGYGRMQVRRALRKLADAFERDEWPAYENDLKTLRLPAWREKALEAELKGGLLLEADAA